MTLPYNFGSATTPDRNFFKQLQADLTALDGGGGAAVTLVNQALIDATDDGGTITVAGDSTIEAITIDSKRIHFILRPDGDSIDLLGMITYENCSYCIWKGNNHNINWLGNATDPMFKLSRSQYLYFGQTQFTSSQFDPSVAAFWLMSTTSGQVPTQCIFEDIQVNGTAATGLQYGWRIGVEGDSNGDNNDFHRFIRCSVNNYDICAYSIEQPEAKFITFHDSGFGGGGFGQYGVSTALNGGQGGSFLFHNGGGGNNTIADFYLGAPDDLIVIQGLQLESSDRVLITTTSGTTWGVLVRDCRIATDNLNADGQVIIYSHRGPFMLTNCSIEASFGTLVEVNLAANGRCAGVAIGNSINSTLDNPFTTTSDDNGRWETKGNMIGDGTGAGSVIFPMMVPVLSQDELPSDGVLRGGLAVVTDCNTAVIGAVITGAGANDVLAWHNGTAWKVVAS